MLGVYLKRTQTGCVHLQSMYLQCLLGIHVIKKLLLPLPPCLMQGVPAYTAYTAGPSVWHPKWAGQLRDNAEICLQTRQGTISHPARLLAQFRNSRMC